MKPFSLLIGCVLMSGWLSAQPIHSWPISDSYWEYQYYDDFGQPTQQYMLLHLDGDTLIQSQTYQKVIRIAPMGPHVYECATREQNGAVFVVYRDSLREYLLYDFNAQVGDTVHGVIGLTNTGLATTNVEVVARDTITTPPMLDGPHIRITVQDHSSGVQTPWVDGIGGWRDYFFTPWYLPSVSGAFALECMRRETGQVVSWGCHLLGNDRKLSPRVVISPNPASGVVRLETAGLPDHVPAELHDLQGRVLKSWPHVPDRIDLSGLPAGLYVLQITGDGFRHTEKIVKD